MHSIYDFANVFIDYFAQKGIENDLTNTKLNKLLYLSYGLYLSQTGKELFKCEFKTHKYGVIETTIYKLYERFVYKSIPKPLNERTNNSKLSGEEKQIVNYVIDKYADISAWLLSELINREINVNYDYECDHKEGEVIGKEKILSYFKKYLDMQKRWELETNRILQNSGI